LAEVRVFSRGERTGSDFANLRALLIAVKTYDTQTALAPLREFLPRATPLVSLQNGLVQVAQIDAALGPGRPIALAPTTEAAWRDAAGYRRVGRGSTCLGWATGRAGTGDLDALADVFRSARLAVEIVAPVEPYLWAKVVVNASLNPVAALAGRPNGFVLDDAGARERLGLLAAEACAVARAEGIALPFADPAAFVLDVARATAANRCSLLADLERGGATEIDAINGEIVRRAGRLGVPVPENARVLDEVRRLAKA
jgi:2-dehydropantoate 2-reductase